LGPGITETFAHADRIDVREGETVWPGQQVGLSGGEGLPPIYSNGPHVHYSLFGGAPWDNTKSIDPSDYLNAVRRGGGIGGLFNPGDIPGAQAIADAITAAYTGAETAIANTVKRIGWFILGLLLIGVGLFLLYHKARGAITAKAVTVGAPIAKAAL
jgi:hypothetical protein